MEKENKKVAQPEKAVLVGVVKSGETKDKVEDYLNELAFLVDTAGGVVVERFMQQLEVPNPQTYVGKGKLEEIHQFIKAEGVSLVVFDDELGPSQIRNIEKVLECKILDRTNLILDIFAKRARTSHAKVQVELAQYEYLLPRLTRMWTHLERQRGGIGLRGPGETEIETDRRIIRNKISLLKKKLEQIDKQMATQRKNRGKMVRVALVGYTNVGKSTLMNLLSKSDIFAENKLFATLDTTVRKVVIENLPFLISDTVGFIRKLPHGLVESFKSTLDEVRESDILIHVVDISHPEFEQQMNTVNETLAEIGAGDKDIIMVFNKIDLLKNEPEKDSSTTFLSRLESLKSTWMAKENQPAVFISAHTKENYEEFKKILYAHISSIHAVRYPYNDFLY